MRSLWYKPWLCCAAVVITIIESEWPWKFPTSNLDYGLYKRRRRRPQHFGLRYLHALRDLLTTISSSQGNNLRRNTRTTTTTSTVYCCCCCSTWGPSSAAVALRPPHSTVLGWSRGDLHSTRTYISRQTHAYAYGVQIIPSIESLD